MLARLLSDPETWKHASIPIVAGLVGWGTNWLAIVLTFRPLEFVGRPPWLGWQGIIPSKATKMAGVFVDSTMSRLGSLPELFDEMEPERIAEQIVKVISPRVDLYTDEVMLRTNPRLWHSLPSLVKQQVYSRVRARLPELVRSLMRDVGDHVESVLDFKDMITRRLERDKALLNRLFLECGAAEFRFIINSGFHFGFLFGLVQLAVWIVYPAAWVLPVAGLIVGWATNWIALNVIFRPLEPRRIGPWTLQGLFLKRQQEVARVWCHIVTREIITVRALIQAMLTGPRAERTHQMIREHIRPVADEAIRLAGPAAELTVGPGGLNRIREAVAQKAVATSIEPFNDWGFNKDRAVVIERLLRERMESLPADQFQDLLRPCFQEDETKLILIGAVLGLLAGFAQLVFVFGGG